MPALESLFRCRCDAGALLRQVGDAAETCHSATTAPFNSRRPASKAADYAWKHASLESIVQEDIDKVFKDRLPEGVVRGGSDLRDVHGDDLTQRRRSDLPCRVFSSPRRRSSGRCAEQHFVAGAAFDGDLVGRDTSAAGRRGEPTGRSVEF
jgi:hypothetical protein